MKKVLLFVMLCMMSVSVNAQNYKNDGKPYAFFCMMQGFKNLSGVLRIQIIWNNKEKHEYLRDENGEKVEFKSIVDMLNYMSKRGWEYVEQIDYDKVHNYVFKKYVTNDAEAKEGLYFESDFEKKK